MKGAFSPERRDLAGVRLWLAFLDQVDEAGWPALYGQMDPARQERCDRYRREGDRRRCILADALARHALADASGADPGAIPFETGEKGKPFAPGLGWEFSLSHSGQAVLCAVSKEPVGADIQRRREIAPAMGRRFASLGGGETDFFAWWTRQEAAGKLAGTGVSLKPLPGGLAFRSGELTRPDGAYVWCVCQKGLSFCEKP